jgi:isopentenyl-diphosphate delta-isomerase
MFDQHDHVVLVNDFDEVLGAAGKLDAHARGLLHRAFSIFVFNESCELLLQRRAFTKYHSGGLWANTCCGHPRQNERIEDAAHRRLCEEMGFDCELRQVGIFRYREPVGRGLIEHEIDYLFVGAFVGNPKPHPEEVSEWKFARLSSIERRLSEMPDEFAAWFPIAFSIVRHQLRADEAL